MLENAPARGGLTSTVTTWHRGLQLLHEWLQERWKKPAIYLREI